MLLTCTYIMLLLVNLITDSILSRLSTGAKRSIAVFGNI